MWNAASSERVESYRRERGLTGPAQRPAVLVQRMVDADASGVAFSADPVSGRRGVCVIAATSASGVRFVSGDVNADSFFVSRSGEIMERRVVEKRIAHAQGPSGTVEVAVPDEKVGRPSLANEEIRAVATLARATERHFGRPQDIEWAIAGGRVYLLQSRPITSMNALADPDGNLSLWDNSNIAESYSGVTTPLTFSFARGVYEEVYRQFCRIVGVPEARIVERSDALRAMLGLVREHLLQSGELVSHPGAASGLPAQPIVHGTDDGSEGGTPVRAQRSRRSRHRIGAHPGGCLGVGSHDRGIHRRLR